MAEKVELISHTQDITEVPCPPLGSQTQPRLKALSHDYKPTWTKTWVLIAFMILVVACSVLTRMVIIAAPDDYDAGSSSHSESSSTSRHRRHNYLIDKRLLSESIPSGAVDTTSTTMATNMAVPTTSAMVISLTDNNATKSMTVSETTTMIDVLPSTTPGEGNNVTAPNPSMQLRLGGDFTGIDYFLIGYLPRLVIVVIASAYGITFAALKLMEPYYQLASAGGSAAQHSILVDFFSAGVMTGRSSTHQRPYSLFVTSRPVMLLAASISVCMLPLTSLVSEFVSIVPEPGCEPSTAPGAQPCSPTWVANKLVGNILQAILALVLVMLLALTVVSLTRRSGLKSDPSSIAHATSLLGHPLLMDDLMRISPSASNKEVKQNLTNHVYKLGYWTDNNGRQRYGVSKLQGSGTFDAQSEQKNPPHAISSQPTTLLKTPMTNTDKARTTSTSTRPPRRSLPINLLSDTILLCLILALFSVILAYKIVDQAQTPFNDFMNSGGTRFGPRFILTGAASAISLRIKSMEQRYRVLEPYRRMASAPRRADKSLHATLQPSPFLSITAALRRREYFTAVLGFTAGVLSEVLTIVVAGVPFSKAQIPESYLASTYISLVVLGVMSLAVLAVLVRGYRDLDLPRQPDSLVNVWLYLCGGNMVNNVHGEHYGERREQHSDLRDDEKKENGISIVSEVVPSTQDHQNEHRDRLLGGKGTEGVCYTFGRTEGPDGKIRWAINGADS